MKQLRCSKRCYKVKGKIFLKLLGALLFVALPRTHVYSQLKTDSLFAIKTGTPTLTLTKFYKIILDYHPIVKQAELLSSQAQENLRFAKGYFDPKIATFWTHKEFENKTYYSKLDASLSLPTRFPINPKIGYEHNTGALVNSEDAIPGGKQLYAGVSIPIGKGLLTDHQRTVLKQAMAFQEIAVASQIAMINKVLLEAAKDYWQWYYSYYQYKISDQGVSIAEDIFSRVKINFEQGEAALIDTVQARITLQSRLIDRQENFLDLQNAVINVSNYLWMEDAKPLQINTDVAPIMDETDQSFLTDQLLEELVNSAKQNHPEIIKLKLKSNQLKFEHALARENLKPQLDFNYSLLSQPSSLHRIDPVNDYKVGLDFSYPLFLRKERAKLKLTQINIENNAFDLQQAQREIINEIITSFNQVKNTSIVLSQQKQTVDLYSKLLQSELVNLDNGESDLFKMNIQQEKLLQSQTKWLKLLTECKKNTATLYWAAGNKYLQPD